MKNEQMKGTMSRQHTISPRRLSSPRVSAPSSSPHSSPKLGVPSHVERAIEDLFAETSEDEQKSVREDLRRIESILSGAAYDPVSPSASGASATFVAVQLDVEDCSEDRGNLSAEVLTSLIERFDASARQTSDTLLAMMMRGYERRQSQIPPPSTAAILATLEDGLDEAKG